MGEGISLADKPGGTAERFSNEHAALAELLGRYFDGLSHGDTVLLRDVFNRRRIV
jgi:hypothetical protein